MPNTEEEPTTGTPKHVEVIEVTSVHNTPPNQVEPGAVETEETEEAKEE